MSRGRAVVGVSSRTTWLAFASVWVWLAAAAAAEPLGVWRTIGVVAVALGAAVVLLDRSASAALLRPTVRLVLLGIAAGGLMVAATYLAYPPVARIASFIAADTMRLYAAFRAPSLVVAAVALVPVVVGEELVWRGVVQATLARRLGDRGGVALAAAVSALVHVPLGSPVLAALALLFGLALGVLRATTASLVPSIVAHLVWNVVVLLWLPLDSGALLPPP